MNKVIIVDSSALGYSVHHTMGFLKDRQTNMATGVSVGFLSRVLSFARKFQTGNFIFCWDSGKNFRKDFFPEYKVKRGEAKRHKTKDERESLDQMFQQFKLLREEILPGLGFRNVFYHAGYESDDMIAKILLENRFVQRPILLTSDNDMFQCLDFCDIYLLHRKEVLTKKAFIKEYGIRPNRWAMAKAIGGCSSDEVPGVPGVADPKSKSSLALKYLKGNLSDGKVKERILSKQGRRIIRRNLKLVKLPFEGPPLPLPLKRDKFDPMKFRIVFSNLDFRVFLRRESFTRWVECFCPTKQSSKKGGSELWQRRIKVKRRKKQK